MSAKKQPPPAGTDGGQALRDLNYSNAPAARSLGKEHSSLDYQSLLIAIPGQSGRQTFEGTVLDKRPIGDPVLFDRQACALGLKSYIRPATEAEMVDDGRTGASTTHVLVDEIAPGVRTRMPIVLMGGAA